MKIRLKFCKWFEVYKVYITLVVFALLTCSVTLPNVVRAISLGSVAKKSFAEVRQDETAEFTILFWNMENSSYVLTLSAERAPENWTVIISPEKFVINQSEIGPPYDEGKDVEYVNTQHGNVKVLPIKVYVKVPRSAELETYEMIIRASTYLLDKNAVAGVQGTGVSVLLERVFRLSVKVVRRPTFFEDVEKALTDIAEAIKRFITGMDSDLAGGPNLAPALSRAIIILLVIIAILLISWKVIYKYA